MPATPRGYDPLYDYVSDLLEADEPNAVSGRIEVPVLPDRQQEDEDHGRSFD